MLHSSPGHCFAPRYSVTSFTQLYKACPHSLSDGNVPVFPSLLLSPEQEADPQTGHEGLNADVCVSQLEVPTSLNLLPGQIHMLREAVEKEMERLKDRAEKSAPAQASVTVATSASGHYMPVLSEMPA